MCRKKQATVTEDILLLLHVDVGCGVSMCRACRVVLGKSRFRNRTGTRAWSRLAATRRSFWMRGGMARVRRRLHCMPR